MAEKIRSYDFFGNIAVVRFPNNFSAKEKKKFLKHWRFMNI